MLTGLVCTVAYVRGYITPTHQPPNELTHWTWLHLVRYFLTYIGSPFWTEARLSRYFGLAGIGLLSASAYYLIRSMRDWIKAATLWQLLACYTLVCAAITALARIRFGVYQAASSRYCAMVIPFWISLIVILSMILVHVSPRLDCRALTAALALSVVVFMSGYSLLYFNGLRQLQVHNAILVGGLPYVMEYDTAPDHKLRVFHPLPQRVRALSQRLEQYRLGPFARLP